MAIKATQKTEYSRMIAEASQLRAYLSDVLAAMNAGPVSPTVLRDLILRLNAIKSAKTIEQIQGVASYAEVIEGEGYDIVSEYAAAIAAVDALLAAIVAEPQTHEGYVLHETWSTSGVSFAPYTCSPNLKDAMAAVIAAVE